MDVMEVVGHGLEAEQEEGDERIGASAPDEVHLEASSIVVLCSFLHHRQVAQMHSASCVVRWPPSQSTRASLRSKGKTDTTYRKGIKGGRAFSYAAR